MHKFSFASVNMRRHNAAMHVLLNDNGEDDLLCIQEPWFNPVGMARCDDKINGKDVLGGAANPRWRLAYPSVTNGQWAKVMTYIRLHDRVAKFKPSFCQMIVRNDLASHPCLLIMDIRTGTYYWRVINFYNDVADPSALDALVALDLDATIPTLLVGDFNLHSPSWSPTGWDTSRGAHRLEEWTATQTLELLMLRSVDRSVRLGRLGVCPECLMAEVGKRLDYNGVHTTERWINTQGESACQALKGKGRKGLYKVFQPKRMRCRDSTKYAQRGCIGEVAEALQSIQLGPSDTRSQSYRLLAKLSSLIY
jgi:hypothetical protein